VGGGDDGEGRVTRLIRGFTNHCSLQTGTSAIHGGRTQMKIKKIKDYHGGTEEKRGHGGGKLKTRDFSTASLDAPGFTYVR
jgi:hypothetical protein